MSGNLEGVLAEARDQRLEQERANWLMAKVIGLQPEWLDKTFTFRNKPVTIVGLAPTRTRYPVVGKNERGDIAYYPVSVVLKSLVQNPVATD